ncbi:hypothetical protein ABK040_015190 [Willaertia magna]
MNNDSKTPQFYDRQEKLQSINKDIDTNSLSKPSAELHLSNDLSGTDANRNQQGSKKMQVDNLNVGSDIKK